MRGAPRPAAALDLRRVRDELHDGKLEEYCPVPDLHEEFWAIGVRRRYAHPLLKSLLERSPAEMLAMDD